MVSVFVPVGLADQMRAALIPLKMMVELKVIAVPVTVTVPAFCVRVTAGDALASKDAMEKLPSMV